ncbi:MAG: PhoX family phosphatase [Actinobacteria bacterium]|nr:PhoX family phosphatase [Actinomycetota bacterium]
MTDLLSPPAISAPHFEDVVRERISRRGALKAMIVVGGGAVAGTAITKGVASAYASGELAFDAIALNTNDQVTLSTGFKHDILISWGDPVVPGAPAFDIQNQTVAAQAQQFGFNNDYTDFKPLPYGSNSSTSGLLFVNHEYTSANMMFPGVTYTGFNSAAATSNAQKQIEIEAHGASIIEVALTGNTWGYNPSSAFNRRITGSTAMAITGPAAGTRHMQTNADPTGTTVLGMFNNCGGGSTPWGTVLTAEENFDQYFGNHGALVTNNPADSAQLQADKAYAKSNATSLGIVAGTSSRGWEAVDPRFDMAQEWNEPFRFGWIAEIDPYTVASTPKKRTALGRFKHEAAAGKVAGNGKYVVYMGDDQANQFIYKFVTAGTVDTGNRLANDGLLDSGTLYVAKFNSDGSGTWMPLVFGSVPALSAPSFEDQADLLIRTRVAAAALGATPMDRPEDVEVNPISGFIYAAMTGTSRSTADAANPRVSSAGTDPDSARGGHVIEIRETGNDHTATTFAWEIFMLCGNPNAGGTLDATTFPAGANSSGRTYFAGFDETQVSPIARPDNVAFDSLGNLWITTDGMPSAASGGGLQKHDTIYGVPTAGAERGHLKALCSGPKGCEMTGPYFTADDKTLFAAIQHPGEDGNIGAPQSTWNSIPATSPAGTCARNAVIAIRRLDASSVPAGTATPPAEIPEFPMPVVAAASAAAIGGVVAWRQSRMNRKSAIAGS